MAILQPILQPILKPVLRSVFDPPTSTGDPLLRAIRELFARGEQGALYYLTKDFAGLYQDAAGTVPVTAVGQPVGLMMDRRSRSEFIPASATTWVKTAGDGVVTVDGNIITISGATIPTNVTRQRGGLPRVAGVARMTLRADYTSATGVVAWLRGVPRSLTNGVRVTVAARLDNSHLERLDVSSGTATFTIESLEYWQGNHASQRTTTARPVLRDSPLRIDYDGVDDYLRTVFPDLGSNVTIARSIPGVGAQILTGQTIAAGNWDDNVDSCATLVIDRALTPSEQTLVTAFLNQRAGV